MTRKEISNKIQEAFPRAFGEMALLIFCILPGIIFSLKGLQSPWNMFRIARASLSLQEHYVATFSSAATGYRSEHLGIVMVHIALLDASDWSLESFGLLPIGSLLLAILYYAVSREISRSSWAAAAITIFASWYYPRLITQFGSHAYAWTNILFLSFLILLWYWLRDRTPIRSMFIMLIFIATFLHYQTASLWIIAAMTTAVAAIKLKERQRDFWASASWALPLFCVVTHFAFDTVVYGNALARFQAGAFSEHFSQSIVSRIIAPFQSRTPDVLDPFVRSLVNPRIATWTTSSIMASLIAIVGIWCLVKVCKAILSRDLGNIVRTKEDIFIWSVVVVAATHALAYMLYGAFSLRVVPLAFPLLLPLVVREFRLADKLELILTFGLAVLAIVGLVSCVFVLLPDTLASETGLASKLFREEDRLLSDPNVYGSLLLNTAREGKITNFVWLDSDKYAAVIGQRPVDRDDFDYAVVDTSNKLIISESWVFFEPWTWHLEGINQNKDLNKIYDSENLMVFQPRGTSLPDYQLEGVGVEGGFLSGDAFKLFLTTIILLFMPGAIFVFILQGSSSFRIRAIPTFLGLAVGMSIVFVTFTGYIVNFTPLGLGWLAPLCEITPWGLLGIYLLIRRPRLRLQPSWVISIFFLVITLLVWSLSATWVAHTRTQRHAEFTEFFVTQADPQSSSFTTNVVNRLSQSGDFTIVFELDGVEVQTKRSQFLAPGSAWIESWNIPSVLTDGMFIVTLERDGVPYRELRFSFEQTTY